MGQFTGNQFQAISDKKIHSQFSHYFLGESEILCMQCSWLPPTCLQRLPYVTRKKRRDFQKKQMSSKGLYLPQQFKIQILVSLVEKYFFVKSHALQKK